MSYLGFMVILKSKIMAAKKPESISQPEWDNILKKLGNEDHWEGCVIECTKTIVTSKSASF